MSVSDRRRHTLIKRQPLLRREWVVFFWRLAFSCLISPLASYAYLRAMRIEGLYNPREFAQALLLRLGRNARLHSLDPMRPKQVARLVYRLGEVPPTEGRLSNDVGEGDGNIVGNR